MQGISDIITIPGLVNVDFADVKAIMCNSGTAMLGVGVSSGKSRAEEAAMVRKMCSTQDNLRCNGHQNGSCPAAGSVALLLRPQRLGPGQSGSIAAAQQPADIS